MSRRIAHALLIFALCFGTLTLLDLIKRDNALRHCRLTVSEDVCEFTLR